MRVVLNIYRAIFARAFFYRFNRFLYRCSLSGLGVLNYENPRVSGELFFLRRLLVGRSSGVVLDVGANVGGYSAAVLEVNRRLKVYAFEPHPRNYSCLKKRISAPNFLPFNAAAGVKNEVLSLFDYSDDDGTSHASLYRDVIERIHHSSSVEHKVQVLSLDDFAAGQGIEKIDLLKVDVEGNELNVLKGFGKYISSGRVEVIHFEFNEMNVVSGSFFRDFFDLLPSYDFYRLLPGGMIPLGDYVPVYCEIFAYQNIVAFLKRGVD